MPTIYNVVVDSHYEGESYVKTPKLYAAEAGETAKLFKLDGKNSAFGWAINLPKAERYMSPNAAWAFWLEGMTAQVHYFEQGLNDALALRDLGIEQSEKDCRP